MTRMRALFVSLLLLAILSSFPAIDRIFAAAQEARPIVVVRGRIVGLDSKGQAVKPAEDNREDRPIARVFAFEGEDGRLYRFLADDSMTAMFADRRVRDRQLQITAQLRPENGLEVIKVQAIRGGKLYDFYYYCEVCNVTAYGPGLCPCCRDELEFRETATPEL